MAKQHESMRPFTERALKGSSKMKRNLLLGSLLFLVPGALLAQAGQGSAEGKVVGGYAIQQSVEVGGRIADVQGNANMFDTLENLHSGPRLLDQELNMRSINHDATVFDNLYLSSFGYGGDPQAGSRLRISKTGVYDFNANFRHDINYFNDNYLANPYNTANGYVVWNQSAHYMNTRRNMGDFRLTLFPESAVRVRLGFSRMNNEGPSLSSFHEGTDLSLYQNFRNRQDQYQAGIDVTLAPRTTLSYDQTYDYNKVDTSYIDNPTGAFYMNAGTTAKPNYVPVDIGGIYSTYYGQPCSYSASSPIITPVAGVGNVVKTAGCNLYLNYSRFAPTRANFPTERLSFTSDYWKKLNVYASGSYTSGANKMNDYEESANTFVTRTNERGFYFGGPSKTRLVSSNFDLSATFHITDQWYVTNQVKSTDWRIPGVWNSVDASCYPSLGTTGATILSPVGTLGNPYCQLLGFANANPAVVGLRGNGADYTLDNFNMLHSEKRISDLTLIGWEPNRHFGAHLGYRYQTRTVGYGDFTEGTAYTLSTTGTATAAPSADDSNFAVAENEHEHSLLMGAKVRPVDAWLINADFEMLYSDAVVTAIAPQHQQALKLRSNYKVSKWGTIGGFANITEGRNSVFPEGFELASISSVVGGKTVWTSSPVEPARHMDHNRNYGLNFAIHPKPSFTVDFGYTYLDLYSSTGTCIPMTLAVIPEGGQISRCPSIVSAGQPSTGVTSEGTPFNNYNGVPAVLEYQQKTNTGYINFIYRPVQRVAFNFGYDVTSDSGRNDWLRADTLAPFRVPVDANGNVIYAGNANAGTQVGYAAGPNPAVGIGPLALNWHTPSAGVEVAVTKAVTFKGVYKYFGYNEKSDPGIVAARDTHANTGTLSLRYAF